jgi:hypothetical protein
MLSSLLLAGGVLLLLVMGGWMNASARSRNDKAYARQDEYFTPRLAAADRQLQALAARLGGGHERGVVEWRSFATPGALQGTADLTADPVWGRGSVVRAVVEGYEVEVTFGVQPLNPRDNGPGALAIWCVLLPRFTVIIPPSRRKPQRFDATWLADDEAAGVGGRLFNAVLDSAFSSASMPPDVQRTRQALIEKASRIWCGPDRVQVDGAPLPRAPNEAREFGQGDFSVESMVESVGRTIELVRALETG